MRIKFNDKIYRLKEIESGVDSLMELVEEPRYKDGDFLRTKIGNLFIFKRFGRVGDEKEDSAFCHFFTSVFSDYKGYGLNKNGVCFEKDIDRYCTPEEKQKILDDLAKDGKRWNAEKKCVEDIPKRKFKVGDKVKIKDGISSKTHGNIKPIFTPGMDAYIGRKLTVKEYIGNGRVIFSEDIYGPIFDENWLEPWSDEPKAGDWVVAWDDDAIPTVGILDKIHDKCFKYRYSVCGINWQNIIKFDGTVDQFEKIGKA